MEIDLSIPPEDWSDPKIVPDLLRKAKLLAPLTLADVTPTGWDELCELVSRHRRRTPLRPQQVPDDFLLQQAVWRSVPEVRTYWNTPNHIPVAWPPPESLLTDLHKGIDQETRFNARMDWLALLFVALKMIVASATHVNGRKINAARLREESDELRRILDLIIECNTDLSGAGRQLQEILDTRLVKAGPVIQVAIESDQFVTLAIPRIGDLGTHNTLSFVELFRKYPLSSLRRCEHTECSRIFIPGAEGRVRSSGAQYCCAHCRFAAGIERRKEARHTP